MRSLVVLGMLLVAAGSLAAQDTTKVDHEHMDHAAHHRAIRDTSFASLKERGGVYMGVDQDQSAHRFDSFADGGRIELLSTTGDSADVAAIRRHFAMIAEQFRQGDFRTPFAVHDETVPGTDVMQAKRAAIRYEIESLPRGAALRLRTGDKDAIAAIHTFMEYQRKEHHSPGHE
ncbi:MAG: hypothetical protein U0133_14275 [Gemmatimonadales bacterium]